MVERLNRTIQNMLATVVDDKGEWEEYLAKVCLAYNTIPVNILQQDFLHFT